jgi:RNA polymerase sigma factor (sigma-70 family)
MTRKSTLTLAQRARRALARTLRDRPAAAAPDHGTLNRMRTALDTMDEMQRAVFERARFRNLEYRQIARELGITPREVERHLASALLHIWRHTDPESER